MDTLKPKIDWALFSDREIEDIVDKGLRHRSGLKPVDYLKHWLFVGRQFAFATMDDSWGEFEKLFSIIIRRMVAAERENAGWQPMATAPRDGTHILIAFGEDGVSSAMYCRDLDDAHPWKFLDRQQEGVPIFNGARDDKYGPTGWMPLPAWRKLGQ